MGFLKYTGPGPRLFRKCLAATITQTRMCLYLLLLLEASTNPTQKPHPTAVVLAVRVSVATLANQPCCLTSCMQLFRATAILLLAALAHSATSCMPCKYKDTSALCTTGPSFIHKPYSRC